MAIVPLSAERQRAERRTAARTAPQRLSTLTEAQRQAALGTQRTVAQTAERLGTIPGYEEQAISLEQQASTIVPQISAIGQPPDAENYIKLPDGWVSKEAFNALSPEDQKRLQEMGVAGFNAYYQQQSQEFEAANVKLDYKDESGKNEYVPRETYDSLTPTAQQKLNEMGVEAFNEYVNQQTEALFAGNLLDPNLPTGQMSQAEQDAVVLLPEDYFTNITRLNTGQWVAAESMSLPAEISAKTSEEQQGWLASPEGQLFTEGQNILMNQGITAYQTWAANQQQRYQVYQQAVNRLSSKGYISESDTPGQMSVDVVGVLAYIYGPDYGGGNYGRQIWINSLKALGISQEDIGIATIEAKKLVEYQNARKALAHWITIDKDNSDLIHVDIVGAFSGCYPWKSADEPFKWQPGAGTPATVANLLLALGFTQEEINNANNAASTLSSISGYQTSPGQYDVVSAVADGKINSAQLAYVVPDTEAQQAVIAQATAIQHIGDNLTTSIADGKVTPEDLVALNMISSRDAAASYINTISTLESNYKTDQGYDMVAALRNNDITAQNLIDIGIEQSKANEIASQAELLNRINDYYDPATGTYDLVGIITNRVLDGEELREAGFSEEAIHDATTYIKEEVIPGMTPEKSLAEKVATTYLEIVVPGLYLGRHWGEMSPVWRGANIALEALIILPMIGWAAKVGKMSAVTAREGGIAIHAAQRATQAGISAGRLTGTYTRALAETVTSVIKAPKTLLIDVPTGLVTRPKQMFTGTGRSLLSLGDISTYAFRHPIESSRTIGGILTGRVQVGNVIPQGSLTTITKWGTTVPVRNASGQIVTHLYNPHTGGFESWGDIAKSMPKVKKPASVTAQRAQYAEKLEAAFQEYTRLASANQLRPAHYYDTAASEIWGAATYTKRMPTFQEWVAENKTLIFGTFGKKVPALEFQIPDNLKPAFKQMRDLVQRGRLKVPTFYDSPAYTGPKLSLDDRTRYAMQQIASDVRWKGWSAAADHWGTEAITTMFGKNALKSIQMDAKIRQLMAAEWAAAKTKAENYYAEWMGRTGGWDLRDPEQRRKLVGLLSSLADPDIKVSGTSWIISPKKSQDPATIFNMMDPGSRNVNWADVFPIAVPQDYAARVVGEIDGFRRGGYTAFGEMLPGDARPIYSTNADPWASGHIVNARAQRDMTKLLQSGAIDFPEYAVVKSSSWTPEAARAGMYEQYRLLDPDTWRMPETVIRGIPTQAVDATAFGMTRTEQSQFLVEAIQGTVQRQGYLAAMKQFGLLPVSTVYPYTIEMALMEEGYLLSNPEISRYLDKMIEYFRSKSISQQTSDAIIAHLNDLKGYYNEGPDIGAIVTPPQTSPRPSGPSATVTGRQLPSDPESLQRILTEEEIWQMIQRGEPVPIEMLERLRPAATVAVPTATSPAAPPQLASSAAPAISQPAVLPRVSPFTPVAPSTGQPSAYPTTSPATAVSPAVQRAPLSVTIEQAEPTLATTASPSVETQTAVAEAPWQQPYPLPGAYPEPAPQPVPAPAPVPEPIPQPIPQPVPEPISTPVPVPVSAPTPVPIDVPRTERIPVPILAAAGNDEEKARQMLEASVTWKQGLFWMIRFPPYGKDDIAWEREVPEGVTVIDGPGSAYATIQKLNPGAVPEVLEPVSMGFQEVGVTAAGQELKYQLVPEKTKLRRKPKRKYTKRSSYWQRRKKQSESTPQLAGGIA